MSLINITDLSFAYEGSYDNVFENVSFSIDTDWRLGFTGRNGRGKTTFLKLLLGKYEYSGNISASVDFDYFPFEAEDEKADTIDIINNIVDQSETWKIYLEFSLLNIDEEVLYRPFSTLSNGERTKVLLAALFIKENNFLLIDEPTNHLDTDARKTVSKYLRNKNGFILVSHDREFLDNCVDHILSINKTNIEVQKGNFSSWWHNKQLKDSFEQAENEKLTKDISRLTEAAGRNSQWSDKVEKSKNQPLSSGLSADKGYIGHKSAKMMKRAKSIETRQNRLIDGKKDLLKNIERADELKITPVSYHSDRLAELENVNIFYDKKQIGGNISFKIMQGDRLALRGRNGSGKTSILKLIAGTTPEYTGNMYIAKNLNISYIPQDTSFLKGGLKDYALENKIDESLFKAILRKLDFSRSMFDGKIENFSAGQKKKVLVAGSLCCHAHLYIWDEPLNYIDVLSRMQIEDLILKGNPTMIFVEHDEAFLNKIATSVVDLK